MSHVTWCKPCVLTQKVRKLWGMLRRNASYLAMRSHLSNRRVISNNASHGRSRNSEVCIQVSVLYRTAGCCSVLHDVAGCCRTLQLSAVVFSGNLKPDLLPKAQKAFIWNIHWIDIAFNKATGLFRIIGSNGLGGVWWYSGSPAPRKSLCLLQPCKESVADIVYSLLQLDIVATISNIKWEINMGDLQPYMFIVT